MELSSNLRRLRREANITQEALAALLHVSGQAVSKWERGESYPEITMLPALADALNAAADALLRAPDFRDAEAYFRTVIAETRAAYDPHP